MLSILATIARLIVTVFLSHISPYVFENDITPLPSYDFIVVGSGSSGSVVASRLSETDATVLLLERGGSALPESSVPALAVLLRSTENVETLMTEPSAPNYSLPVVLGNGIGGGNSVCGMVYLKGTRQQFDNWAKLGNEGWDYDSILPYYKKTETYEGELLPGAEKYYGRAGPVTVVSQTNEILSIALEAAKELGIEEMDVSSPIKIGIGNAWHTTQKNGVRASVSESYLRPVIHRKNLLVKPRATVTRIIVDETRQAKGVEYSYEGKIHKVKAKKEVILSAGAIHTPRILMLSGIGPADQLKTFGIKPVAVLNGVGQNLQDKQSVNLKFFIERKHQIGISNGFQLDLKSIWNHFPLNLLGYKIDNPIERSNRLGDYTTIDFHKAPIYLNVADPEDPTNPDVYISLAQVQLTNVLVTQVTRLRSTSNSSVTLSSKNIFDPPRIILNFGQDTKDFETLVKGIKFTIKLLKTDVIQRELSPTYWAAVPDTPDSCKVLEEFSDKYWDCIVRNTVIAYSHFTGTCKMAPSSDKMGVVDSRLRLRGVKGIRIVDASVMPLTTQVNPVNTCQMIGEKGADLIKEDWKLIKTKSFQHCENKDISKVLMNMIAPIKK